VSRSADLIGAAGPAQAAWQRLVGVVLGSPGFVESVRQQARGNPREQKLLRAPTRANSSEQIVAALERSKGQSWNQFAERHGDWGRDAALWLGRSAGRLRLAELGRLVGNLDYAVVSKAITWFQRRMQTDPKLREHLATIQAQLPK
jgi:hypothetical protein